MASAANGEGRIGYNQLVAQNIISIGKHFRFFAVLGFILFVTAISMVVYKSKAKDVTDTKFQQLATIEISKDETIVASNPGNILLISAPDFPEYKRLLGLSANTPEEFQKALASGTCRLIPDNEKVEVVGSGETPAWVQIKYQGERWWVMATFIKDSDGETWGVAEMVEKMSNRD